MILEPEHNSQSIANRRTTLASMFLHTANPMNSVSIEIFSWRRCSSATCNEMERCIGSTFTIKRGIIIVVAIVVSGTGVGRDSERIVALVSHGFLSHVLHWKLNCRDVRGVKNGMELGFVGDATAMLGSLVPNVHREGNIPADVMACLAWQDLLGYRRYLNPPLAVRKSLDRDKDLPSTVMA
ncbi:hypothetical protein V6N11_020588 [Hibiscus sabdariffa]|uniref:Uncharacterized protein n=1 Tax=Hibiscus sabdariffa TaxID=183260 RepID=A0ABR2Q979_9ROSI